MLALIPVWLWLAGIPVVWVYSASKFPAWFSEKYRGRYCDRCDGKIVKPKKPNGEEMFMAGLTVFGIGLTWIVIAPIAFGMRRGYKRIEEAERVRLLEAKADELARTVGLAPTRSKGVQLPRDPYGS